MKIAIALFITVHGLIHILGFLKAFNLTNIEELTRPISKPSGIIWLITCLVFIATAVLYLAEFWLWFGFGFSGIVLSQALIFQAWKDAKFGSILNVFLGILILLSF